MPVTVPKLTLVVTLDASSPENEADNLPRNHQNSTQGLESPSDSPDGLSDRNQPTSSVPEVTERTRRVLVGLGSAWSPSWIHSIHRGAAR